MSTNFRKIRIDDIVFDFLDVQFSEGFTIVIKTDDEEAVKNAFTNAKEITILSEIGQVIRKVSGYEEIEFIKKISKYYTDENNVWQPAVQIKLKEIDLNEKIKMLEKKVDTTVNESTMTLDEYKSYRIKQSKDELEKYIADHPIKSTAHGGVEAVYTITSEKQMRMVQQLLTYDLEIKANPEATPVLTWNESGEVCEEWTLEEFTQLLLEVKAFVYPLIVYQQNIEKQIMNCDLKANIAAIIFDYDSITNPVEDTTEESENA